VEIIRRKLDPLLGNPSRGSSEKMFTITYKFDSEIAPVQRLKLKLEINTREHFSVLGYENRTFILDNPWFSGNAAVSTYKIDELMGTKLRALYQRKKGRDLFDLWLCLEHKFIDPDAVISCFIRYMQAEGHPVTREMFEKNLTEKSSDKAFTGDISPLLAADIAFDPEQAMKVVRESLIQRLP
jgi:predicted nucleotidyltransferase component of viral defense system